MFKSLLALWMLASVAQAGTYLSSTVNYWKLNGNRNSELPGGEAMAQGGTLAFGATACGGGSQGATSINDTNFPKVGTTTLAAMQGLAEWTAAGYVYTPSAFSGSSQDPAVIEFYQSGVVNYWVQVLGASGAVRAGRNNAVAGDSAAGLAAVSTCYYVALVGTLGNRLKLSWSPATAIDSVFDVDAAVADANLPGAMTAINFGRLDLAANKLLGNGFLYGWRLHNQALSTFPIVDGSSNRSPYLDLFLYPEQGLLRRLLAPFVALALPRTAYAHAQSQVIEQRVNEENYVRFEARTGRLTRTPTPNAIQRRTATPTPVVSGTPTSTYTPVVTPTRTLTPRSR